MKAFQIFLSIGKYMLAIVPGVVAVEKTIGSEAPGTSKKQVILDAIQAAAKVGETSSNVDVALASVLIDSTVGTLNAVGFFSHAPAATSPTPAA
jgi:hypothetical protein